MKNRWTLGIVLAGGLLGAGQNTTLAQSQGTQGNRAFNPFSVQFQRAWNIQFTEPVKLIEVGLTTEDNKNRLLLLVGGKDKDDYKRRLLVMRWNELQFVQDASIEFIGAPLDSLLLGPFRAIKPGPKPAKGQPKTTPQAANQIIATNSVYAWNGASYGKLFAAPPETHAALLLEKKPGLLLSGGGDKTVSYEVGDTDTHPVNMEPPADGGGYLRFGVGAHDKPLIFQSGTRFVQSYWFNKRKWFLCLVPGMPANLPDAPDATTGDRLVVYTPRLGSRDKSFWATKPEDLEESWRSEPLPGRVLDVRVGDPKNEGREGILVLTAENSDKDRRLHFFAVVGAGVLR